MTENLDLEFGYNCKRFLPTIGKCRRLIDSYRGRKDLVEQKLLKAGDLLVYLNLSREELNRQITSGEIRAIRQKDGKVTFSVATAWSYDDCFLANGGGQCLHFAPHTGKAISCLDELKGMKGKYSNYGSVPSEAEVRAFEESVIEKIGTP